MSGPRTISHADSLAGLAHVARLVGSTPHLPIRYADPPHATFHLKLEGQNPTGSVKDRAGLWMIREAITPAVVEAGPTLLDASSGNMACALVYFGALVGLPATMVVSSKLTKEKRSFLEHFGATLIEIGSTTIEGNRHCRELADGPERDRYLFLDQLHNWSNPQAHYDGTGPEIYRAFPHLRMLVGSLGSGGTLLGTARYLKERIPDLVVVATESAAGTRMPGVGGFDEGDYITPFIQAGLDERSFDVRFKATLADSARELLAQRGQGVFGGLQTGAVLCAARETARTREIAGDVVVISGDSGWKNVESLASIRTAAGTPA